MDTENKFRLRLEIWTTQGGMWEADNHTKVPNSADGYIYETWLDPHALSMMFKIYERWGEERKLIWSGIHYWEARKNTSTYLSLGVNGEVCHGYSTDDLVMNFIINHKDGTTIEIKSNDEVIDANQIKTNTWVKQGEQWCAVPGGLWRRKSNV